MSSSDSTLKIFQFSVHSLQYLHSLHMKSVSAEEMGMHQWFLPHHAVFKQSNPSKCRVVFDCVAQYKAISLKNAKLYGPNSLNNLSGVLIRFRKERVVVIGDIKLLFHHVLFSQRTQNFFASCCGPVYTQRNSLKSTPSRFTCSEGSQV